MLFSKKPKKKAWTVQVEFTNVLAVRRVDALKLVAEQARRMTPPKGSTILIYVLDG